MAKRQVREPICKGSRQKQKRTRSSKCRLVVTAPLGITLSHHSLTTCTPLQDRQAEPCGSVAQFPCCQTSHRQHSSSTCTNQPFFSPRTRHNTARQSYAMPPLRGFKSLMAGTMLLILSPILLMKSPRSGGGSFLGSRRLGRGVEGRKAIPWVTETEGTSTLTSLHASSNVSRSVLAFPPSLQAFLQIQHMSGW